MCQQFTPKKPRAFGQLCAVESWDNVGLIIEPSGEKIVKTILLTNDLTEDVMAEAVKSKADLIISYHPPIFRADLLVTGEMSHHEVLDFVHKGKSVILADHSNTERGFLDRVKERIRGLCEDQVEVLVAKQDRDPLKIV